MREEARSTELLIRAIAVGMRESAIAVLDEREARSLFWNEREARSLFWMRGKRDRV